MTQLSSNLWRTLGTTLTAVFTGVMMWINLMQNKVLVTPMPNGGFTVSNPNGYTIVIRSLIARQGTLRTHVMDMGSVVWGNYGKTSVTANQEIGPYSEHFFDGGIYMNGNRRWVVGKARRCKLLQNSHMDIILQPGEALSLEV